MPRIAADYVDVWLWRGLGAGVEFLLLRRAGNDPTAGLWLPVMGKVEAGETAAAAALREAREETGLSLRELYQIDPVHTFFLARTDTVQMTPVFAAPVSTDAVVSLSVEHSAFRWVAVERIAGEVVWPGQRACVLRVIADVVNESPIKALLRVPL